MCSVSIVGMVVYKEVSPNYIIIIMQLENEVVILLFSSLT